LFGAIVDVYMIVGIGVDLIEIDRVAGLLAKDPDGFLGRIGHPVDQKLATSINNPQRLHEFWAGRFAAKEAFSKALGCGFGKDLEFTDIGVGSEASGKPVFIFSDRLKKNPLMTGVKSAYLSISHDK
jgi:holo-[acyl-carrier protein] synthase